MAKISKATERQQVNRNKSILERLVEEHSRRTHPTAIKQLPLDADQQSDLSVIDSTVKPKIDVHLAFMASPLSCGGSQSLEERKNLKV